MRIVGGEFSSRKIITSSGRSTRPTLDKVREAVFSSLGGLFDGGTVLDLYAGSGAVGLEALSRGYDRAIFADISKDAIRSIRENIHSLNVEECTEVFAMKDMKALALLSQRGMKLDLVCLDPPYALQHNHEVLTFLDEHHMLNSGARVVIESLKEETYDVDYPGLHPYKEKVYGISKITYYRAD